MDNLDNYSVLLFSLYFFSLPLSLNFFPQGRVRYKQVVQVVHPVHPFGPVLCGVNNLAFWTLRGLPTGSAVFQGASQTASLRRYEP